MSDKLHVLYLYVCQNIFYPVAIKTKNKGKWKSNENTLSPMFSFVSKILG